MCNRIVPAKYWISDTILTSIFSWMAIYKRLCFPLFSQILSGQQTEKHGLYLWQRKTSWTRWLSSFSRSFFLPPPTLPFPPSLCLSFYPSFLPSPSLSLFSTFLSFLSLSPFLFLSPFALCLSLSNVSPHLILSIVNLSFSLSVFLSSYNLYFHPSASCPCFLTQYPHTHRLAL